MIYFLILYPRFDVIRLGNNAVRICRSLQTFRKYTASIFKDENGCIMFLRNVGIYLQPHATLLPRIITSTSLFSPCSSASSFNFDTWLRNGSPFPTYGLKWSVYFITCIKLPQLRHDACLDNDRCVTYCECWIQKDYIELRSKCGTLRCSYNCFPQRGFQIEFQSRLVCPDSGFSSFPQSLQANNVTSLTLWSRISSK
jgi:hypothetical protein